MYKQQETAHNTKLAVEIYMLNSFVVLYAAKSFTCFENNCRIVSIQDHNLIITIYAGGRGPQPFGSGVQISWNDEERACAAAARTSTGPQTGTINFVLDRIRRPSHVLL